MPNAVWVNNFDLDVPRGHLACGTCGANVPTKNRTQHENFHLSFSNMREQDMSKVSWCDYGDHPFKNGEEGSASFQGTEFQDGVPVQTSMDACAKHNPLNVGREATKYALTKEEYRDVTE